MLAAYTYIPSVRWSLGEHTATSAALTPGGLGGLDRARLACPALPISLQLRVLFLIDLTNISLQNLSLSCITRFPKQYGKLDATLVLRLQVLRPHSVASFSIGNGFMACFSRWHFGFAGDRSREPGAAGATLLFVEDTHVYYDAQSRWSAVRPNGWPHFLERLSSYHFPLVRHLNAFTNPPLL